MIVDSSAIIAIVLQEPGYVGVLQQMIAADAIGVGTPTLVESGIVLSARAGNDSRVLLGRLLQEFGITSIPFGEAHWFQAIDAYLRFGKGRHPASLNFGDCLAYATARVSGQPLLCTGNDFAQTDLELIQLPE